MKRVVKVVREEREPNNVWFWVYERFFWFWWEPVDCFRSRKIAVEFAKKHAAGPIPDQEVGP